MATPGNWWELPLPPGWERKFDPGSNRYFYLNHSNKQTTWEDPRIQLYNQLQARGAQPQQQHYGQAAQHAAQQQQHHPQQTQQQQYAQAVQQHLQAQQQQGAQQRSPQTPRAHTPQHQQHSTQQQHPTPQQQQQTPQQQQHPTQHQQHTSQQQHHTPQQQQHTTQQQHHHTTQQQQHTTQPQHHTPQQQHASQHSVHQQQHSPRQQPSGQSLTAAQQRTGTSQTSQVSLHPTNTYNMVYQQQQVAGRQPSPTRQSPARQPSPTPQRSPGRQPSPARSPNQPTHRFYHNQSIPDNDYTQEEVATQRAHTPDRTAAHPKPASHQQHPSQGQAQRSPYLQPTSQNYGLSQQHNAKNQTWAKGNYPHPKPALTRPHALTSGSIQMQEELRSTTTEDESSDDETSFITADPFEFNKLHSMFPTAPEGLIKKILAKNNNDHNRSVSELQQCGYQSSHGAQATSNAQKVAIIKRLKQSFPQVDQEMLDDVLRECGGDEQKARRQLASLGFSASGGTAQPQRAAAAPSRPVQRAPSPPRVSEADKQRMFHKFAGEFKGHPKSIIEMALDASGYDETKARILLQSMESPKERKRVTSPSRTTTSSESSRPEPASVSGVVVNVTTPDSISRPGTSASTVSTSTSSSSRPSSSAHHRPGSADHRPSSSSHHRPTPSPSKQAKRQQPKLKAEQPKEPKQQQPKGRRQRDTTRNETRPVRRARSAERPAYVSALRTKPDGPNALLAQGPSKDNLLTDYVQTHGHQSDLAKGPDRNNLIKSYSMSEGPQASNRQGPNPDLVAGPMHLSRTD